MNDQWREILRPLTDDPKRSLIVLDVDGTVAEFHEDPDAVTVHDRVPGLITKLTRLGYQVIVVTGGSALRARRIIRVRTLVYGLSGAEILRKDSDTPELVDGLNLEIVPAFVRAHRHWITGAGLRIDDRGPIVGLHWRGVSDEAATEEQANWIADTAHQLGLDARHGNRCMDLLPPGAPDKGDAVYGHLEGHPNIRAALVAGDDISDLAAINTVHELEREGRLVVGIGVAVRSDIERPALLRAADLEVGGVPGNVDLLRFITDAA